MDRREALKNVAFLMGGILSASTLSIIAEGCNPVSKRTEGALFDENQQRTIDEIADIIIPKTDSPGAKEAGVGAFIAMMIDECYPEAVQKSFVEGLDDVEKRSQDKFKKSFADASQEERTQLIHEVAEDTKKKKRQDRAAEEAVEGPYFFQLIRELTLLGYFTSEPGATQALAYVAIPGRYDGCVPLKPGQKAWAT